MNVFKIIDVMQSMGKFLCKIAEENIIVTLKPEIYIYRKMISLTHRSVN
jgi:hypothetical protein